MSAVAMALTNETAAEGVALSDRTAIEGLVAALEAAWNDGDGVRFAQPFAENADFVNIYGRHAQGWWAIAEGHEWIFRNVYAGSRVTYAVGQARLLRYDVALVHLRAHLSVPQGPMAGEHDALPSLVLIREMEGWKIAAFQNTLVSNPAVQQ